MMKQNYHILILTFAMAALSLQAQKVNVHFEGTIFDEENEILRGAFVEVKRDAAVFNFFKADENGTYNLYLPLNGEYDITISKPGYVQKKYFVSTKNIPEQKSQIAFATNVADVVLFNRYEGVNYELFERPMNMYSYSKKKDNIVYDEDYLKEMKLAMKEFKKMEGEKIALAREKAKQMKQEEMELANENAEIQRLIKQHFDKAQAEKEEKQTAPTAILKSDELAKSGKTEAKAEITANVSIEQKSDKTEVTTSAVIARDSRTSSLLEKYKPGVTEEIFQSDGVTVIQRVLVRGEMVWIYQKKIFSWGGMACFRDRQPITESTFELETKKS